MNEWDVVSREPATRAAPTQLADVDPWAVTQQSPAELPSRTMSEWMGDTGRRVTQTARTVTGGLLGLPTNLLNTATANPRAAMEAGNALRGRVGLDPIEGGLYDLFGVRQQPEVVRGMRESLDIANEETGAGISPRGQQLQQELEGADGFLPSLGVLMSNPGLALQEIVGQAPQLLQAIPGSLPGTIAAQMAGIGSQAEQQVLGEAAQRGMSDEEAAEAAALAFQLTAPVGAAGALVPGGLAVERMLAGQLGQTTARNLGARAGIAGTALAGEGATEMGQEGAEQAIQNYVLGDPLTQDLGSAMAQGLVLGMGMGAPAGVAAGAMARSPGQGDGSGEGRGTEDPGYRVDPETGALEIDIVGGTRESEAGVQSPQAPSAAMADPDLTPRTPATPTIEEGVSREQLVEEWRNAGTPDERAAAAARVAAYDAQRYDAGDAAAGVDGGSPSPDGQGSLDADGQAGAPAEAGGLPAQGGQTATPAPDLPRFPGLTDAQREVESRAADQVRRDPDAALQAYTELPGTDGGRIVNTDEAREIFPEYSASATARSTNAVSVHEPASWVANETFRRRMASPVEEGRDASVFFTGGGTGAGKSTGPKRIAQIGAVLDAADTVFDGNLSSERSAVDKIELALSSGRDVHILYTFRDPTQSFVHGALPRAEREDYGRTVPTGPHASAHIGAAETYFALRDRYANDPRVSIRALWNDFEPGVTSEIREATEEEIRAIADTDRGTLQQELNDALEQERQAGRVSDRVYRGTRGEPEPERGQERRVEQPEPVDGRPAEEAAAEQDPVTDGPSESTVEAARRILPRNANLNVVRSMSDIPSDVRDRVRLKETDTDVEGFYDADTQSVYVIEDQLVPREGQPVEARAAWVAAHEWLGHHGVRTLTGDQLGAVLRRAANNETVAAVVRAMESQRPERGPALVEEAFVELAAAVRTGDYAEISDRYGVTFTADSRGNLRALVDRFINALRRALGWDGFTDAELYNLIADSAAAAAGGPETVLVGDRAPRSRVGTRNPTAVRSTESGVDPETTVGYESFRADPKAFERNTSLLLEYPGVRRPRGRSNPDRVAESFITHVTDNLLSLHDAMPAELRQRAKQWYVGSRSEADRLSEAYGVSDVSAAATIAALSPQKDWFQNLSLAERVIDATVNRADHAWDPGMTATFDRIFGDPKYAKLRAAVEGRPLSDLTGPVERAAWIRTYDQTHNDSAYPITDPQGGFSGTFTTRSGAPAKIQWGSLSEVSKAVSVLQDDSLQNVSALLGRQHKIRSFYNNIIAPNSDRGDVTIDTHAVAAALMRPLSAATKEVGHNFGAGTSNSSVTGNSGMYGLYAEAYRRAAAERGILPREMQSITWEAVRALYLPPSRRPNSRVVRDTEEIWGEFGKRRIEHGEAFQRAVDAGGGIRTPDWAGSTARLDEGEWGAAFRPAVSGAGVPGRGSGPVASRRRDPGRAESLKPLPGAPKVRGATGPDPRLVAVAEAYAKSAGIELHRQSEYVKADPERGRRIADAYEAMEHAPNDPRVRRAYEELIEQTTAQYRALEEAGYRFYFDTTGSNPWDAMRQLRADQTMGVFPTDEGFGSGASDLDVSDNPLMADTGIRWPDGSLDGELRPVLANDLFRAVHDAFGHGLEGAGFRADGEENAWQAHVRLFTGDAVGAITSETRGQNSWLNFGPHGEANRTARVEDTVFADQKTGLMPEWTWTEGRADNAPVASRGRRTATGRRGRTAQAFSAKPRQPDAVSADAYHYSNTPGLTELDPTFAGTAGAGRERRAFGMGRFGERGGTYARLNFYVREPGAPVPGAEDVVRSAGGGNLYRVQLDNLYDLDNDPRGIAEEAGQNVTLMEEEIADAGFDGFRAGRQPGIDTPVAVVFDLPGSVPVENVDGSQPLPAQQAEPEADDPNAWWEQYEARRGAPRSRARNPQVDTPQFRRWFGDSKVVDENGEPLVVYHGTNAEFDAFDPEMVGSAYDTDEQGFFFTSSEYEAQKWADRAPNKSDPKVLPVYLSIENAWTIDAPEGMGPVAYFESGKGPFNRGHAAAVRYGIDSGYDGMIIRGDGETMYVAFRPNQIKSATDNRGTFDPSDSSIIASRRRTPADVRKERGKLFGRLAADGYQMGSPTQTQTGGRFATVKQARDSTLIALHDKMLPLLRAQQQVSEDGRGISSLTLDDAMNAYRAENLMHGAVNDELTGLHYSHIRPIQEAIRKSPFSVDMFEDYLYAKAAPERNREIAKINKAMPDAGSGITTQMAKDIMAGKADGVFSGQRLTPEAVALFDDLNRHVRALRNAALNNMVDAGQITPELAKSLREKYPNYVPMRGKDAELDEARGSRPGTGRGLSQRRANIRRALGRGADNVPVNILGELVGDAQRSVVAKGKAKVARAMLRFALANPNPDLYTVEPVDLEWRFSEATGEAYLGVKRRGEDVDTSMVIMHKGNPVYLRFNDPQLASAMLNAGAEDMGKMMRVFSALNRWRSATLTRYNPAFTPVNMARDFHFGTVAIAAEHGPRIAAQAVANYPSAMRASYRHSAGRRGDASKPDSEKTMQDWAAEAYAAGMSTGITHTPNVVDLQRNLQAATMGVIELAASGRPLAATGQALLRTGRPIIDAIENANEASENAIRLGVYVALRKDGMSKTRAAEYAKNVTINFNRKGKAGPALNAIFLFYNAAMQGGHAVIRVMRNPKVMTYLIGLSIMQGLLSAGLMDDDDGDGITEWDKIPDYVKRTSLVIPLGDDDYFAMPMPYGFNWFTYLGGRGSQRMILGDRPTDSSITVDLAKSLSEAFSPIPFEDGYRSLFGDQVGLAMGLAANRDDFGSPIAQLNPYERYPEPRALQGKVTTPGMYHVMAQLMAKAGGGDLDERLPPIGWLDVAPEHIEEMVNHFGGGITSLGNRGLRSFEQIQAGNLDGAFSVLSSAPITSRLLVEPRESFAIADRYYSERGEFARHKEIVNSRLEQGMSLDEAIADRPEEYVSGMQQATYKRTGRGPDRTLRRRGQPRVDADGKPVVEIAEGTPSDSLKRSEKRVAEINSTIREIRAATITNAELAATYSNHYDRHVTSLGTVGKLDGVTGTHEDIGLPADFDGDAKAPARVRNRAIKILQDMRAEQQRSTLRSVEYERMLSRYRRDN